MKSHTAFWFFCIWSLTCVTHHFDVHGIAGPEREQVLDVQAVGLLVLRHASRVLREALGVDEAVELLAKGREGDGDVLRVARHSHIFDDVWKKMEVFFNYSYIWKDLKQLVKWHERGSYSNCALYYAVLNCSTKFVCAFATHIIVILLMQSVKMNKKQNYIEDYTAYY